MESWLIFQAKESFIDGLPYVLLGCSHFSFDPHHEALLILSLLIFLRMYKFKYKIKILFMILTYVHTYVHTYMYYVRKYQISIIQCTVSMGIFVVKIFRRISFIKKFEAKNFCTWNFQKSVDRVTT